MQCLQADHEEEQLEQPLKMYYPEPINRMYLAKRHQHCPPDPMMRLAKLELTERMVSEEPPNCCKHCPLVDMMPVHWCPLDRPVNSLFSVLKLPLNYVTPNSLVSWKPYCKCTYRYVWMKKNTEIVKVDASSGYFVRFAKLRYSLKTYNEFRIDACGLGEIVFNVFIDATGNVFSSVEVCQPLHGKRFKCNVIVKNLETQRSLNYDARVIYMKEKRPLDFQFRFEKSLFDTYLRRIDRNDKFESYDDEFIMCGLIVSCL